MDPTKNPAYREMAKVDEASGRKYTPLIILATLAGLAFILYRLDKTKN